MHKCGVCRSVLALGALAVASLFVLGALGLKAHTPGARGLGPLGYFAWYAVGAFAFWRRPHHPVARQMLLAGAAFIVAGAIGYGLFQVNYAYGFFPWLWGVNLIQQVVEWEAYVAWVALLAIFPDGAQRQPYERRVVRLLLVVGLVVPVLLLLSHQRVQVNPWFAWKTPSSSPLYLPDLSVLGAIATALWWARFPSVLVGVALLLLRARFYRALHLLQIQWAVFASAIYVVLDFTPVNQLALLVGGKPDAVGMLPWEIAFALMPLALVVVILRHRLLDIELVLRRSVVYGALWLVIAFSYAALAALLGIAAGQRFPVSLAVVVTIVSSMVFGPARHWMEGLADRWVFGERLSGYELLRRFGATLEETFAVEELAPRVAAMIRQGLDVRWVRISLYREGTTLEPVGADGVALGSKAIPAATAPLLDGTKPVGRIDCGPKAEGSFRKKDQELLETLGRQAALALRNSRLAAELADRLEEIYRQAQELTASRTRIVQAEETERRRIERNIHDGVQQEIVALLAKLRLARNQLGRDPGVADATLAEIQEEARQALEDLRELARGIHPPVLSDRGLLEAVEARAARLPLGITIEAERSLRGRRYDEATEGAAYFLVCEALSNVLKHASARHATVRLAQEDGKLLVEVIDDGKGFTPNGTSGSGLRGLADRIEALGGDLRITSSPGEGTSLAARLPVQEMSDV